MTGPNLKTARLMLRPCEVADIEPLHALWTNDRVRHFLFDDQVILLDEARSFVEASLAKFEQHGYGLWVVAARENPQPVGFAGFLRTEETPSLIYGIHPDLWGRGYATEAAAAVLDYVREQVGLLKVRADVDEPNVSSIRVLEKLGMKRTCRALIAGRPLIYFEESCARK